MPFEVSCSQCHGRLLVEQAGLVACPHCGTRLNVAEPPSADVPATASPTPAATSAPAVAPNPVQTAPERTVAAPQPEPVTTPANPTDKQVPAASGEPMPYLGEMAMPETTTAAEAPSAGSALDDEDFDSVLPGGNLDVSAPAPVPAAEPTNSAAAAVVAPTSALASPLPAAASGSPEPAWNADGSPLPQPDPIVQSQSSVIRKYTTEKLHGTVSKKLFALVISYSSTMTLAVLYLAWQLMNGGGSASSLESLPDVKPQRDTDGNIGMSLIKEAAEMPPGHTLALGDSRRFGNLKVTPLRVTRGPVKFEFHLKDESRKKPDGGEILQLWLRFENVSTDQSIAPLDGLVFRRDPAFDIGELDRANNFVCARSEKKKDGHRVLVYELNRNDVWNLRNQSTEFEIPPGESFETYIPTTEEGVKELLSSDAPYLWRVHFRKGYSPRRYGVTTVVEVSFDKSDVVATTQPTASVEATEGKG